jgi:hypothetical protein
MDDDGRVDLIVHGYLSRLVRILAQR